MKIFELDIFGITLAPSYYWLMYAIWFIIWYIILSNNKFLKNLNIDTLFIYIFVWVILWWRLWYLIFGYSIDNLEYYLYNPIKIIATWDWWMSFHWGLIWVILSIFLFSRIYKANFFKIMDHVAIVTTIWLFFWRIWNYINQELLGYYPYYWLFAIKKDWVSYFPSALLEAFSEWIILYLILSFLHKKIYLNSNSILNSSDSFNSNIKHWITSWAFLLFYWIFRFAIEFVRLPDSHIWYLFWTDWITKGQLFSLPMIIVGILLVLYFKANFKNDKTK